MTELTTMSWRSRMILLSVICALSPFGMSVIVPSFPGMSDAFSVDAAGIQYMVSAYLLGLGLAQPVLGIFSDRYGRRIVLLCGFALFFIASLASVLVDDWGLLIVCRCLQGMGVSAGTVTSRAMITDSQEREAAAASYTYLALAMMIGPLAGPLAGAFLDTQFGWRGIFASCAVMALIIWVLAYFNLRETLSPQTLATRRINFNVLKTGYAQLLTSPGFIGYTLIFAFCQGIFFCFLPIGPDIFIKQLGFDNNTFLIYWLTTILVYLSGTILNTFLLKQMNADAVMNVACLGMLAAGVFTVLALILNTASSLLPLWVLLFSMFFTGMATPLALNGAVSANPEIAGLGSGLSSALGMSIGGVFSILSGIWYDLSMIPMLVLMAVCAFGTFLAFKLAQRQPLTAQPELI